MYSSDDPFDSSSIFYENPNLMNLPNSLLVDEELLFEHLLIHQSPPSTLPIITNSMEIGGIDPNIDTRKDQEESRHVTATTSAKAGDGGGAKRKRCVTGGGTGRRRAGKKDRHSKIYTAQGPRDRRMRLSLQIARKFFDLQDMLGFDKASKTIEWLFNKSKSAIRDLTAALPPHQRKGSLMPSFVATSSSATSVSYKVSLKGLGGSNDSKPTTRNAKTSSYSRESREKARARARQRTLEKNKKKELLLETNPNKLRSSSTPEIVDSQAQQSTLENQMSSVSIIEKLLGSDSSASSSSIYDDCSYLSFPGNWATDSSRMYPSYGAIGGVDELQVILQQQNPNSISPAGSSGYQLSSTSRSRNLL